MTEEKKYLKELKKNLVQKLFIAPYRMENIDSFKIYPRKFHRFKLGEESLIETILLSKCDGLTYVKSNLALLVKILSKKIKLIAKSDIILK